jgi:four helix bundle protein
MNSMELKGRTMDFAVRVLRLADALPQTVSGQTLARQVARSGTSVAANYRAALRGKSRADFANKITIVLEEADETDFWIELGERAGVVESKKVEGLRQEAEELVRIFAATRRTARSEKSSIIDHRS